MDRAVVARVVQALEAVYSPATSAAERQAAEQVCAELKADAQGPAYGMHLAARSNGYAGQIRHFGLQLVEEALRQRTPVDRPGKLTSNEVLQFRDQIWALLEESHGDAAYIREKLVALLVMAAIRMWPGERWVDLSTQLLHMYQARRALALRVWQTLGEELFTFDRDTMAAVRRHELTNGIVGALLPRAVVTELYPGGYRLASDPDPRTATTGNKKKKKQALLIVLEEGNDEGWIERWLRDASDLASRPLDDESEAVLSQTIDTLAVFIDWLPVRAIAATALVERLVALLRVQSDSVRICVAGVLEALSKRNTTAGEDRDTVLLQFAVCAPELAHVQAAASTWEDADAGLAFARALSRAVSNAAALHWARKGTAGSAGSHAQALVALLMELSRDQRFTVASPALNAWVAILRHAELSQAPAVNAQLGTLAELATMGLLRVSRAAQRLEDVDSTEVDSFETTDDLRTFLTSEVRSRLLNVVRGVCALDPPGFIAWITPALAGALDRDAPTAEAALMAADTVLATLDDSEQRALADGDAELAAGIQSARAGAYELGRCIVQLAAPQTTVRQLQTLPALAFLLRPAAVQDNADARDLLLAVLRKCTSHVSFQSNATDVRELRAVARRATAALVRLALAIPDSLMLIHGDLTQLIQGLLDDPQVAGTMKSYLREFLLALVAGATGRSLIERKQLAAPVVQPIVDALRDFVPALQTPADFLTLLGVPALDHAQPDMAALCQARENRNRLTYVINTLNICLGRTLDARLDLSSLWADLATDLVPPLLQAVRCLHALWNPQHWRSLPWQTSAAQNLFGLLDMSAAERRSILGTDDSDEPASDGTLAVEVRALHHTLSLLRESTYKSLGRLAHLPSMFALSGIAQSFTESLFADVEHIAARHWSPLLLDAVLPSLCCVGNWPGQDYEVRPAASVKAVQEFAGCWLPPLFGFCEQRLTSEWQQLQAAPSGSEVADEVVHEKVVRDWTRAWSQVVAELLQALAAWIPGPAQIENELASAARVSASSGRGSRALGRFLLSGPPLAIALTASLCVLRLGDAPSTRRVLLLLAELVPSLTLLALLPLHAPPTPTHASIVNTYSERLTHVMDGLLPWLTRDLAPALADVLRNPALVDQQDLALTLLADLAYYSTSLSRMSTHWTVRNSAADQPGPGPAFCHALQEVLAQDSRVSATDVEQQLAEILAEESKPRRRCALIKIALQPMLAVEKSKLFDDKQPTHAPAPSVLRQEAPAQWTNRFAGARSASVLDNDAQFDLSSLMP
ncbi:karyopherin [Coemansia sp. RSA 552]|nr:karyopherin [Coemansia sp. RSA 552]